MDDSLIRIGRWWIDLTDGRIAPHVSGGAVDTDGVEVEDPPDPAAPPAGAEAGTGDGDTPPPPPWEGKTPEELWNTNTKLINENKTYKERFRPYEEAFSAINEQDASFMLGFVRAVATQDQQQIAMYAGPLKAALEQMTPAQRRQAEKAIDEAVDDFDPYDPNAIDSRVQAIVQQQLGAYQQAQQQEQAVQTAQASLQSHTEKLATKHGIPELGDATSLVGRSLWLAAFNDFPDEPDPMARLDLAAKAIEEDLRRRGQELLKAKASDGGPSPVPADAEGPSGSRKPRSMSEASASARERIEKMFRGMPGT